MEEHSLHEIKILIVDDDPNILEMCKSILSPPPSNPELETIITRRKLRNTENNQIPIEVVQPLSPISNPKSSFKTGSCGT